MTKTLPPHAPAVFLRLSGWFCLCVLLLIQVGSPTFADDAPKPSSGAKAAATKPAITVELTLDFGDGSQQRFVGLAWNEGQTVYDALELAAAHKRGFKITSSGKGELLLVIAIADLKNEGAGSNWIYEVNGKMGDTSCAVAKLKGGDAVLWRFGKYE